MCHGFQQSFLKSLQCKMSWPTSPGPSGPAVVDNQGPLDLCTRFALGKAIVDGFHKKQWVTNKTLDIDQGSVTTALVKEHDDVGGKWPNEFDGKDYKFQDVNLNSWWKTRVKIDELSTDKQILEFKKDIVSLTPWYAYLLVYEYKPNSLHCVYITKFDTKNKKIHCLNSKMRSQ